MLSWVGPCVDRRQRQRGTEEKQTYKRVCVFLMSVSVNNPINQVRSEKRREQRAAWSIVVYTMHIMYNLTK